MALKFAKAMGMFFTHIGLSHIIVITSVLSGSHCTVISRGEGKRETSMQMGADAYIDSTNEEQFKVGRESYE